MGFGKGDFRHSYFPALMVFPTLMGSDARRMGLSIDADCGFESYEISLGRENIYSDSDKILRAWIHVRGEFPDKLTKVENKVVMGTASDGRVKLVTTIVDQTPDWSQLMANDAVIVPFRRCPRVSLEMPINMTFRKWGNSNSLSTHILLCEIFIIGGSLFSSNRDGESRSSEGRPPCSLD